MIKRILCILLVFCLLTCCFGCSKVTSKQEIETEAEIIEVEDSPYANTDCELEALSYLEVNDISLDKEYTLEELLVILYKTFNLDEKAEAASYQCPYTACDAENQNIIAYAYASWVLYGINDEDLGSNDGRTAELFMACLLRLMGYSDRGSSPDFTVSYSSTSNSDIESSESSLSENDEVETELLSAAINRPNATEFAKGIGVSYDAESGKVRGDYLVGIIWSSLSSNCKDGDQLSDYLVSLGSFSSKAFNNAQYLSRGEEIPVIVAPTVQASTSSSSTANDYGGWDSYGGGISSGGGDAGGGGDSGGAVDSGGGGGDSAGNNTEEVAF